MTLPATVANPQLISVTSSPVVAVVAPAACSAVTVQQQQGSDPPSHKFNVYKADLSTQIGLTQNGGANYIFAAPAGTFFTPGQTVGGIELVSTDSGTGNFSVFADVAPGGQLPVYIPDAGVGGMAGIVPTPQPGDAALGKVYGAGGLLAGPLRAAVTLTNAQLLAIQTTAILIIPKPPLGYLNVLTGPVTFNYVYKTAAFTLGNADNVLQLEYVGQSSVLQKAAMAGFADQTVNGVIAGSSPLTTDLASSVAINLGIEAKLTGTTPALTVGAGTITVTADYRVIAAS